LDSEEEAKKIISTLAKLMLKIIKIYLQYDHYIDPYGIEYKSSLIQHTMDLEALIAN
jgi:hypothetical protein